MPATLVAVFWDVLAYLGGQARLNRDEVLEATQRAEAAHRATRSPRRLYRSLCGKVWALAHHGRFDDAEATVAQIASLEDPHWPGWLRSIGLGARATLCDLRGQVDAHHALLFEPRTLLEQQPGEAVLLQLCRTHLALVLTERERYDEALALVTPWLERGGSEPGTEGDLLRHAVTSLAFLGRVDEALAATRRALPIWQRDDQLFRWGFVIALVLALSGHPADAARVLGLEQTLRRRRGAVEQPMWRRVRKRVEQLLTAPAGDIARWRLEGASLTDVDVAALVLGGVDRVGEAARGTTGAAAAEGLDDSPGGDPGNAPT